MPTTSQHIINRLKRRHKVTIRELKARMGITLVRIRFVLKNGVEDHHTLRDWVQAITGTDPGSLAHAHVAYRRESPPCRRLTIDVRERLMPFATDERYWWGIVTTKAGFCYSCMWTGDRPTKATVLFAWETDRMAFDPYNSMIAGQ